MGGFVFFFLLFLFHSNLRSIPADMPAVSPSLSPPHTLTVSRLGNVTLQCDITDHEQVTWYILRSYEFTLLIWAEKTRTRSSLPYHFNKNESHFVLRSDPSVNTAMMTITRLTDDDLGLYYCGTKVNFMDQIRFGKPTQLQFEDEREDSAAEGGLSMCELLGMYGGVTLSALLLLIATLIACSVIRKSKGKYHAKNDL